MRRVPFVVAGFLLNLMFNISALQAMVTTFIILMAAHVSDATREHQRANRTRKPARPEP